MHVIDDSFLQPPRGTSAADHLVSGLVPLAALALAAWVYPAPAWRARVARLRWCSACWGSPRAARPSTTRPAATTTRASRRSRPDSLLLGVGAVTLWRTRRRDGAGGCLRRVALGFAGLLVFLFGVLPVGMAYVKVHVAREAVPPRTSARAHEDVTLTTSDGLTLKGWYVPSRNGAAVIAFPGRKGPQPHARMLDPPRLRRAAARPSRRGRERGRSVDLGAGAGRAT